MNNLRSIMMGLIVLLPSGLMVSKVSAEPLGLDQSRVISVIPQLEPARHLTAKFDAEMQNLMSRRSVAVSDCYSYGQQVDLVIFAAKPRRSVDKDWLSLSKSVKTAYERCEPMRNQLRNEIGFFDRVVYSKDANDVSLATNWRSEAWQMMSIHYSNFLSKYARLNDLLL